MEFRLVEENLRESFRVLAAGRSLGDVMELPGVSIASLGVSFQMFNAAFLSAPVETSEEMETRLESARQYFEGRSIPWSFWICEDWLARGVQRRLSRICKTFGLRLSAELPGMATRKIETPARKLPELEVRAVDSPAVLRDFRAIGSTCFHVPLTWFSEVFDERFLDRRTFVSVVGYHEGVPVTTAASVTAGGAIGLYNIATAPEHRDHGYAEAITRYAIDAAIHENGAAELVLQATSQGYPLYERMGFRAVTRILAWNSI